MGEGGKDVDIGPHTHVEGLFRPAGVEGVGVVGAWPHQMVRVVDAAESRRRREGGT